MDTKETPYIKFGVQYGDVASAQTVDRHISALRQLLKKYCNRRYAPELDMFYLPFRVDGDIAHWDVEGAERLRLMRERRYITIDIMIPRWKWQGASVPEIRQYIIDTEKAGLQLIVNRLKKEHIEVDETRLFRDFRKLEKSYLMRSTFPEVIRIRILDGETGAPLPNIAVFIQLYAYHKKDGYLFMPPLSNGNGEIKITTDWLINEINASRDYFLKDPRSTLEYCQPRFKLWMLKKKEIAKAVEAMNLFEKTLDIKQEDIEKLSQADNPDYEPVSKLVIISGEKVIQVDLITKRLNNLVERASEA